MRATRCLQGPRRGPSAQSLRAPKGRHPIAQFQAISCIGPSACNAASKAHCSGLQSGLSRHGLGVPSDPNWAPGHNVGESVFCQSTREFPQSATTEAFCFVFSHSWWYEVSEVTSPKSNQCQHKPCLKQGSPPSRPRCSRALWTCLTTSLRTPRFRRLT